MSRRSEGKGRGGGELTTKAQRHKGEWKGENRKVGESYAVARSTSLATVLMLRIVPMPAGSLSLERPMPLGKWT